MGHLAVILIWWLNDFSKCHQIKYMPFIESFILQALALSIQYFKPPIQSPPIVFLS